MAKELAMRDSDRLAPDESRDRRNSSMVVCVWLRRVALRHGRRAPVSGKSSSPKFS